MFDSITMSPAWIRSQLIGSDAMIATPFGMRPLTYADYVASGRALTFVERIIREQVLPFYANTHTEDSFTGATSSKLAQEAADYIKAQVGAPEYKIIFAGSGSTAAIKRMQDMLGLTVPSSRREACLATLPAAQRPVVFVGPYEHHSNEVSWRESLAEVVELPLCSDGMIDLEALRAALQNPKFAGRPKFGSFSAASNVTGMISDTRAIARVLHEHDAFAFFDFAASAPYVAIDMKPGCADGFDAIFISPHKFIGGPGTPGILVFNPVLYTLATPSTAGGGTVTYVSSSAHHFTDDIEAREDAGTPAIIQKIRAALVFWVKDAMDVAAIEERETTFIRTAITRLRNHSNVVLLGNLEAPRLAMLSFMVRSTDGGYLHPRLVVRLLNDLFGIQARGGCACAGPYGHRLLNISDTVSHGYRDAILAGYDGVKPGWTRLNFNSFISDEEFEFLLAAIEFVADYGERFVHLYHFDWRTGAWTHPRDVAQQSFATMLETALVQPATADPDHPSDAPDYQRYLAAARELATSLVMQPARHIPAAVNSSLVFFMH
ncbi:MAG: aminotransferase class V-fold PLP-dependent enzyme [Kofleriaceae bacterium]|nr:aminotransferase class V-fold PLP-dependent enzyme [Kofleriaceae bacterium]